MLPDICARPEVGRITGRGNTANLEVVLALKPDLILDVGSTSADLRLARRARAGADRHSLCAARRPLRRDRADLSQAWRADASRAGGRGACALCRGDDGDDHSGASTRIPEASARASTTRAGRAGWRPGSAARSMSRPSSFSARTTSPAERKGGLATVSVEQVLLWNPDVIITIDRDFAANVRSDPVWAAVAAVRAGRVHLSPKLPFGWVDFPPSVNRLIGLWWLAQDPLSRAISRGHRRADPRLLHALLSRDADRRADRRMCWPGGTDSACRAMTRSAAPAC